jgi:hypothetical protein
MNFTPLLLVLALCLALSSAVFFLRERLQRRALRPVRFGQRGSAHLTL